MAGAISELIWRRLIGFKRPVALTLLIAATFGLGGCYLPSDFDAVIQISKDGRYVLGYQGELTSVGLARSLAKGDLSKKEAAKRIQKIQLGLMRRDSGFKAVEYQRQGRFKVDYESVGKVQRHRYVTFVDGSSKFVMIKYLEEDGTVTVSTEKMKDEYVRALIRMGSRPSGTVRIRTDAKVLNHNADQVRGGRTREYTWNIKGFRGPAPKLTLELMTQAQFPAVTRR